MVNGDNVFDVFANKHGYRRFYMASFFNISEHLFFTIACLLFLISALKKVFNKMENAITIFNISSVIFLLITIGIIVSQLKQKKTNTLVFTLVAFIILFIVTLTNISEHFFKSLNADEYEDYIEILFILLIFAIFTSNLHQEHKEKLIERKKLKAIFNQAFSLVGLLDKDGRLIETNETAIKFIECQPDEF